MISFLRNEQEKGRKGNENSSSWSTANQSAVMFYQNMSQLGFGGASLNSSNIVVDQGRKHEDSLSFSRDHSKEIDSIGNSLLTFTEVKKECVIIEPKESDFYT